MNKKMQLLMGKAKIAATVVIVLLMASMLFAASVQPIQAQKYPMPNGMKGGC